ncbi:MAG: AraC family transcriptional regulator [Oscillospiraceae bacterium]|nr:AraC family transcriptional regulator [Oscillospiraceae bacterium]
MKRCKDFCEHIEAVTSVRCSTIDISRQATNIHDSGKIPTICEHCHNKECNEMRVHLYGLNEACRWQGRYVYHCPIGLIFSCAAILDWDKKLSGGFVVGPMIIGDLADLLFDFPYPAMADELARLPRYPASSVQHLSEAFFMLASAYSQSDYVGDVLFNQQNYLNTVYQVKDLYKSETVPEFPKEIEDELFEHIRKGKKAESQELLNQLLGHIYFSSDFNINEIKSRMLDLVGMLSRAAIASGADVGEIFRFSTHSILDVEHLHSMDDVGLWCSGILHRYITSAFDQPQIKHSDIVFKVTDYIKNHYREKLTLDELARYVNLSSSYLSSLFKKETGESLTSYINRVKIENCKRLLRETNYSLSYIAHECCFDDQSYFSKVFKKYVGESPKNYRLNSRRR